MEASVTDLSLKAFHSFILIFIQMDSQSLSLAPMILYKGKGWRQLLGVRKLSWLVRRQLCREGSGVLEDSKKRSQQRALQQLELTTPAALESTRGRAREGRVGYPEGHCKMGGTGDKVQTEKLKSKDQNLYDKHLTGAEKLCHISWVKICLGDDQNTTG